MCGVMVSGYPTKVHTLQYNEVENEPRPTPEDFVIEDT